MNDTNQDPFEVNKAVIDKANFQIAYEITKLEVPKGKVYFFDGDDKVIWEVGKRDCEDTIEIPKGTKKIIADGDLNITGGSNPDYLSMFVDGRVTGRGLNLGRYTSVRATGSVDLVNNNPESSILVMNSGDVTLNGAFRTASANTTGSVRSDSKETAFFEVTTEKDVSIKKRFIHPIIIAGGKSELPKNEEAKQDEKADKHSAKISPKPPIIEHASKESIELKSSQLEIGQNGLPEKVVRLQKQHGGHYR